MDPVTQVLIKCLKWQVEDVQDVINSGACLDESNADLTLSRISRRMGQIDGCITAGAFEAMFNRYAMVEKSNAEAK